MAFKKASFFIVEDKKTIPVYFNPEEYSINVVNTGNDQNEEKEEDVLSLKLYFDTYMLQSDIISSINLTNKRIDVRSYTDPIVKLTKFERNKSPLVCFKWGSLNFKGIVHTVHQSFTMFLDDGMPVRAVLDVTIRGKSDFDVKPVNNKGIDWSDNNWKNNILISGGLARILLEKSSNE